MSLILVSSVRFAEHQTPPGHPERPERAQVMDAVAAHWRARGGRVAAYRFPDALHLPHDLLDVDDPAGRPAIVYPELFRILTTGAP